MIIGLSSQQDLAIGINEHIVNRFPLAHIGDEGVGEVAPVIQAKQHEALIKDGSTQQNRAIIGDDQISCDCITIQVDGDLSITWYMK